MKPGNAMTSKILVLGKSGVGKSLLLLQYTSKDKEIVFLPKTTVEVDYKTASEKVGDIEVRMQIWDTAG